MSVSNVMSAFHLPQRHARSLMQVGGQELNALRHSLSTDDLAGAREAFSAFQQSFSGTLQAQGGAGNTGGNGSPLQNDIAALNRSLKAGDLAGAKQTLAALMQDLQGLRREGLNNAGHSASAADGGGSGPRLNLTA